MSFQKLPSRRGLFFLLLITIVAALYWAQPALAGKKGDKIILAGKGGGGGGGYGHGGGHGYGHGGGGGGCGGCGPIILKTGNFYQS